MITGGDHLALSGRRFGVTYTIAATDAREAEARARGICVEQTVEFPEDLLPDGPIRDQVVGQIEALDPQPGGAYRAHISYAVETVGADLPQLLNVLFGNTSLKAGVRVEALHLLGGEFSLPGPRFGLDGLRQLTAAHRRPLLCTALKPMGLSPDELASMARAYTLGGVDMIKDDHGLADQPFCPFDERVARCAEAVAQANRETGGHTLYIPNLSGPADTLMARAELARAAGAGGVMLAPGLVGWDALRVIASDAGPDLPVLAHPALLGSHVISAGQGIAPRVLFGQLMRLCGADAVIFPHHGGRFPVTEADCRALVRGATDPMGNLRPVAPVPAGGIHLDRLPDLRRFYGDDVVFLIGGDLHRGDDLVASCKRFRDLLS